MAKQCKYKTIKIDMTDDEFLFIAKKAHKKDITFNKMFEQILVEQLKKLEKKHGVIA
jgi:hypothetical protein